MAKFGILVAAALLLQPNYLPDVANQLSVTSESDAANSAEIFVIPTVVALTPGVGWVTTPTASRLEELIQNDQPLEVALKQIEESGISAALEPAMIREILASDSEPAKEWAERALAVSAFSLGQSDADPRFWAKTEIVPRSYIWEAIPGISNEIIWPGRGEIDSSLFAAFPNKQIIVPLSSVRTDADDKSQIRGNTAIFEDSQIILNRDRAASLFSTIIRTEDDDEFQQLLTQLVQEIRANPYGVLAADRIPVGDTYRLSETVTGLAEHGIYLTRFNNLPESKNPVSLGLTRESSEMDEVIAEVLSLITTIVEKASSLPDPLALINTQYDRLISFTSSGWVEETERFSQFFEDQKPRLIALSEGMQLEVASSINIFGSSASIPLIIQNPFDQEVKLEVIITSHSGNIDSFSQVLNIPAQSRNTEKITPVTHGNGAEIIDISLVNEAGEVIFTAKGIELNVQTEWELVGVISIIAVVVLLLALGILRSIKKRRKI